MRRAWIAFAIASGCGKSPTVDKPAAEPPTGSQSMMKTPGNKASFVKGPALTPKDALVAWLDAQKRGSEPRLVRVPLIVPAGQVGFDIGKAKIGELEIYANDSALGEGLADQAGMTCEGQPSCAFLVEGYWRGKQAQGYRFDVVKARALEGEQAFAEVEGESGN